MQRYYKVAYNGIYFVVSSIDTTFPGILPAFLFIRTLPVKYLWI